METALTAREEHFKEEMLVKETLNIELHLSSDFGRINYKVLITVPIQASTFSYVHSCT